MRLAFAVSALLVLTSEATWATPPHIILTTVEKDAPVGIYAVVRRDCSVGTAPEIRVIHAPSHGILNVQDVQINLDEVGSCKSLHAPARRVTYRPTSGFTGEDQLLFEIIDRDTSQSDPHPVTIVVQPAPPEQQGQLTTDKTRASVPRLPKVTGGVREITRKLIDLRDEKSTNHIRQSCWLATKEETSAESVPAHFVSVSTQPTTSSGLS